MPEKRREVTTEGGLDVERNQQRISTVTRKLSAAGIRVSLFVEPTVKVVKLSAACGAHAVELHTGKYCGLTQVAGTRPRQLAVAELKRIAQAALAARKAGMHAHAGHGFDYVNVRPVVDLLDDAGLPLIEEYNIGHAIVCRAALVGMTRAVREMVAAIAAP